MKLPPEVQIKSSIRTGSVYYFPEDNFNSPDSHYFVVINIDPFHETTILLVCASSRINNVKFRRKDCPAETLIYLNPEQYPEFSRDTVFDCNYVIEKTIDQLETGTFRKTMLVKFNPEFFIIGSITSCESCNDTDTSIIIMDEENAYKVYKELQTWLGILPTDTGSGTESLKTLKEFIVPILKEGITTVTKDLFRKKTSEKSEEDQ